MYLSAPDLAMIKLVANNVCKINESLGKKKKRNKTIETEMKKDKYGVIATLTFQKGMMCNLLLRLLELNMW